MQAVFALQKDGAKGVFAYQFPVAAAQSTGGWGHLPIPEPFRERERDVPKAVQDLEDEAKRAAEVAEAAIARAAVPDAPDSLAGLSAPPALLALSVDVQTIVLPEVMPGEQGIAPVTPAVTPAMLDEDAILAATMLLMRRRLTR